MAPVTDWRSTVVSPARRFRTARSRSTLAATGAVAVALIVAGFVALTLQRGALTGAIDAALVARAEDVSALVIGGSVPVELAVAGDDDALVQIVTESGVVVAASANIEGEGPIVADLASGEDPVTIRNLPIGEGTLRLVARTVVAGDGTFTIFAATGLESVNEPVALLAGILLVGIPVLIAFVGVTVWVIIGRALHPVEAIRSQVAAIGDSDLDRRVPVPDTDDEIGRLAGTMNEMLSRLEQGSARQRRFVADASHELRSPLATIRSELEVSRAHPQQVNWSVMTGEVLEEAIRMQRLIDDLLLLARSDSKERPNRAVAVDLDDVVLDQVARLKSSTKIAIDVSGVSGAQVLGDAAALARMVRNLLENAVRYARQRVLVTVYEDAGLARLTVEDDGPGVAQKDRDRIFDRFTRLDEARDRDHGGTGLGLAIVKEIVGHHDGVVSVSDTDGGGARFSVVLSSE